MARQAAAHLDWRLGLLIGWRRRRLRHRWRRDCVVGCFTYVSSFNKFGFINTFPNSKWTDAVNIPRNACSIACIGLAEACFVRMVQGWLTCNSYFSLGSLPFAGFVTSTVFWTRSTEIVYATSKEKLLYFLPLPSAAATLWCKKRASCSFEDFARPRWQKCPRNQQQQSLLKTL